MLHSEPHINPFPKDKPTMKRCPVCGNVQQDEFCLVMQAQEDAEPNDTILHENPNHWVCIMCGDVREQFEMVYYEDLF